MATTDLNHFLSIPWCAKLLNDPSVAFLHTHDKFQDSIRNQGLFADGVSSLKNGVRAQLAFYHRQPQQAVDPQAPFPELSVMFDLGTGVSGWPGISHGGFVSYIFDTVAGRLAMCNIDSPPEETVSPFTMTAKLDVNYRKPVRLDQVLIVTAVIEKIEGRKMHVCVKLEDESREVLSDGAALFLLTNVPRL
ncbi:HotDog domain-containing protein [Ilyonectria robusta]|uniref:HotDog domain-containing protein n=1 Tax=Ilyonectria robusta TaxID=1079257 RepID=UPI001E8E88A4|nr:HotDog domain-containing protein [Ilyonectria robusta]KAH8663302.1 HotDog domain-containing protein [Ilyonectria robusta]